MSQDDSPTSERLYSQQYLQTRLGAFVGVRALLVRHGSVALMSAVGTTYLIRELGPAAWGGFAIAYGLLVWLDLLLSRGVIADLMRKQVTASPALVASAARLVLYTGLLFFAAMALFSVVIERIYSPPHFPLLLLASAACIVLYAARALPATLLERDLRYGRIATAEIVESACFYALAIPAVALGAGVEALAAATVLRGLAALGVIRFRLKAPLFGSSARLAFQRLLPYGLPFCLVTLGGVVDSLIPIFVIGKHELAIGFLATAGNILGYAVSVATAAWRVAIPGFSRLTGHELARATRRSVAITSFLSISLLIPACGLAKLWLVPLLGPEWDDGIIYMQLVGIGMMAMSVQGVLAGALSGAGLTGMVVRMQALASVVYAIGAIVLVAIFGPAGVLGGYAISRWVLAIGLGFVAHSRIGFDLDRSTAVPLLFGGVAVTALIAIAEQSESLALTVAPALAALWLFVNHGSVTTSVRALREDGRPSDFPRINSQYSGSDLKTPRSSADPD